MTPAWIALGIAVAAILITAWVCLDPIRWLRRRDRTPFILSQREIERIAREEEQSRLSELDRLVLHAIDRDRRIRESARRDCQTGNADICRLGGSTGITCPEDSCDIDDGVRR